MADTSAIQPVGEIVEAEFAPLTFWQRLDERLERWGEMLNPILVKETRQALKSKQFTITFVLLLLACLVWSIAGVASVGPEIFYLPSGPTLFLGYYLILCLPLAIIVPFSTFRSLITEEEDNTYELLSISTLTPRQIVTGKLGSSVVQIIVYYSAVAPCLAFSYLLRGISLVSVSMLMSYAFLGALGLSAIGLLMATLAKQKMLQVLLSVLLLAGLFGVFYLWWEISEGMLIWGGRFTGEVSFWAIQTLLANIYLTFLTLVTLASAARLNFPGENGSTPLRVVMLIQQCCLVGWCAVGALQDSETLVICVMMAAVYWWVMGCFFSGEKQELSLRVKRRLPSSLLGRSLLTWFFPGPGKGYVFAVANLASVALLAKLLIVFAPAFGSPNVLQYGRNLWNPNTSTGTALACLVGYLAAYLGIGGMLISLIRRRLSMNMFFCIVLQASLIFIGIGVPLVIQMMSPVLRQMDYTLLQITNPFWTFYELVEHRTVHATVLGIVVPGVGGLVFLIYGLMQVVGELREVRITAPARVLEEEANLHPEPEPKPLSPWD